MNATIQEITAVCENTASTAEDNSLKSLLSFSSPVSLARAARIVVVILGALATAYFARTVVLPVLAAWVIATALKPPVRWLRKWRFPTPIAAGLVLSAFILTAGSATWYLGRPAVDWINSAPESLTRLKDKFRPLLQPAAQLTAAASSVGKLSNADEAAKPPQPVEVKDNHVANTVVSWTGDFLAGAGKTLALVFLMLASGELFTQKLLRLLPTLRDKKQAVEIIREVQQKISTYLFSVALVNVCFGATVGLVFYFIGLPNAWMWGGVVAFANLVPYFGPLLGVAAVGLAGLLAFDTIPMGLMPALVYFVLHLLESNLVTPWILGRRFTLNPVVIFIALIFFLWLWGITGALLAVPILTIAKAMCERIPVLSTVDEFLSR